jgi:flavin-dependent dehydrogenase
MGVIPEDRFDVIVIGGGPGGCCAATFLRRAGRRVLVLEKEVFPRFHIGESLLPYNRPIFDEMGVTEALKAASFPRKHGARFHIGNGSMTTRFLFREGRFTREPEAIQVERATFDHILLKHARSQGADVREGWTVLRFSSDETSTTVEVKDPAGCLQMFKGKFLIDASGRGNMTGNQEGLRDVHPRLKKLAVFAHFTGVQLDEGERAGDTVITRLANKWFWLIPVSAEKTSIGLVIDQDEFQRSPDNPADIFEHWLDQTPPMRTRMKKAKLVGEIQTTSDFSYRNRRFVGNRLVRVGDAAGFMDPIFSAGVYLAMWSGKHAAEAIVASLTSGDNGNRRFLAYERRVRRGMQFYWQMVEQFYTTPFMEIFMNPREHLSLPAAVNAILAGELEGGWSLRWRVWVFFALIKLQARWPIVPRLSFATSMTQKAANCGCERAV